MHSSSIAGGSASNAWLQAVPGVRTALKSGTLTTVAGDPLCPEAQTELLALLAGSSTAGVKSTSSCVVTASRSPGTEGGSFRPLPVAVMATSDAGESSGTVNRVPFSGLSSNAIAANAVSRRAAIVNNLTDAGASARQTSALLASLSGILANPKSKQLAESVDRFNDLVAAAPEDLLANPPTYFLAIHAVLSRLLGTGSTK